MTTPACPRERGRLSEALKVLRVGAGLGGARLAEMLGWQQSKVPEMETRKQLTGDEDMAA
jgi:hypothetical protein